MLVQISSDNFNISDIFSEMCYIKLGRILFDDDQALESLKSLTKRKVNTNRVDARCSFPLLSHLAGCSSRERQLAMPEPPRRRRIPLPSRVGKL